MTQSMIMYLTRAQLINSNYRLHHMAKHRRTSQLRESAGWIARAHLKPVVGRVRIVATYSFPNRRSLPDSGNLAPTTKALVDGMRDARILRDDSNRFVVGEDSRVEVAPDRPGLVKITVTLEPATEEAA